MTTSDINTASCVACKSPMYRYRRLTSTWWINDTRLMSEWYEVVDERFSCPSCAASIDIMDERLQILRALRAA